MITIIYSEMNPIVSTWKEKLDELIVEYSLVQDHKIKTPYIQEGKKRYKDSQSIQQFLSVLESDINDWRTPRCGV